MLLRLLLRFVLRCLFRFEILRMDWKGSEWAETGRNRPEWARNVPEWARTGRNRPECAGMGPERPEWTGLAQNGPEWARNVKIAGMGRK